MVKINEEKMNKKNFMKMLMVFMLIAPLKVSANETQVIAAIAELKGSLGTQVQQIKDDIKQMKEAFTQLKTELTSIITFSKGTYGNLVGVTKQIEALNQRLADQDNLQKKALKALTGSSNAEGFVGQLEKMRGTFNNDEQAQESTENINSKDRSTDSNVKNIVSTAVSLPR